MRVLQLICIAACALTCYACKYQNCKDGNKHSGCYTSKSSSCEQWIEPEPLTAKDKQDIVDAHNVRRKQAIDGKHAQLGGKARNMRKIKWSDELAQIAQGWVSQCDYKHDKCRNAPTLNDYVGQNIFIAGYSGNGKWTKDWQAPVKSWFEGELPNVQPDHIKAFPRSTPKTIGHLTQILWAETVEVGCAYSMYLDRKTFGSAWKVAFIACNYRKGGNMLGSPVFLTTGDCPSGTRRDNDGFCV